MKSVVVRNRVCYATPFRKTRSNFERYLNEQGIPELEREENGGRVTSKNSHRYGYWLRLYDKIAFELAFHEWERSKE